LRAPAVRSPGLFLGSDCGRTLKAPAVSWPFPLELSPALPSGAFLNPPGDAPELGRRPKADAPFCNYMPLVHFFAEASQCMPAFVHAAWVVGALVPAKAGALNATTRPNANVETRIFICYFLQCRDCFGCANNMVLPDGVSGVLRHVASGIVAATLPGRERWRLRQFRASIMPSPAFGGVGFG